jgi:hypothetical protein
VKAFNTIFAQVLGTAPDRTRAQVLYAGDDAGAKAAVRALIESAGFEAVDAGPLTNARLLEPLGMLNIYLGYAAGRGTGIAPRVGPRRLSDCAGSPSRRSGSRPCAPLRRVRRAHSGRSSPGCFLTVCRYDGTYMSEAGNQEAFREMASLVASQPRRS